MEMSRARLEEEEEEEEQKLQCLQVHTHNKDTGVTSVVTLSHDNGWIDEGETISETRMNGERLLSDVFRQNQYDESMHNWRETQEQNQATTKARDKRNFICWAFLLSVLVVVTFIQCVMISKLNRAEATGALLRRASLDLQDNVLAQKVNLARASTSLGVKFESAVEDLRVDLGILATNQDMQERRLRGLIIWANGIKDNTNGLYRLENLPLKRDKNGNLVVGEVTPK